MGVPNPEGISMSLDKERSGRHIPSDSEISWPVGVPKPEGISMSLDKVRSGRHIPSDSENLLDNE